MVKGHAWPRRLLTAAFVVLGTASCGGDRGASDVFDGSSVESQPVVAWSVYGDPTIFNEALVEELRSCGVGGDLGEYVDDIVAQGGPNTIEQQEYEGGEVVASRVVTVADVRAPVTGLTLPEPYEFLYKITCRPG